MNKAQVPKLVQPQSLAYQQQTIKGTLSARYLKRLTEYFPSDIKICFLFSVNEQDKIAISGQVQATLRLNCQRCLANFELPVCSKRQYQLGYKIESPNQETAAYEPLFWDGAEFDLWELIEDEILLCVPYVPKHGAEACNLPAYQQGSGKVAQQQEDNPFAALSKFKIENFSV